VRDKFNAEKEYKDGIKYFISDDIDTALEKFNKAKDYNPYHKNIDRKIEDLEKIKQLRKENRDLENELNKDQYRGEFLY
jgi:predicted component of type VI protein secretion system